MAVVSGRLGLSGWGDSLKAVDESLSPVICTDIKFWFRTRNERWFTVEPGWPLMQPPCQQYVLHLAADCEEVRLTLLFSEGGKNGEIKYPLNFKNHINNSSAMECFIGVRENHSHEQLSICRERGKRKYLANVWINHYRLEMCLKAHVTN